MTTSQSSLSGIRVSLNNVDMWQKFYPFTEMKVKRSGQKLFPELEVNIKGLLPDALYTVSLYLERVNDMKYKFMKDKQSGAGTWKEDYPVKNNFPIEKRQHKDGGVVGAHWMESPVSFSQIYITNNSEFDKNLKIKPIFVQNMHRYQPVVTVRLLENGLEEEFRLTMTRFMAVTTYQNPKIIELKSKNNKRSHENTRGKKRANDTNLTPSSTVAPSNGTSATVSPIKLAVPPPSKKPRNQMVTPPATTQSAIVTPSSMVSTPTVSSFGGIMNSQNQIMTPSTMATLPSITSTPTSGPPSGRVVHSQNQFMVPSTMFLPPSMAPTSMGPSFAGFNNFQNQMMTPAMVPPPPMTVIYTTPPSTGQIVFPNQMMFPPLSAHNFAMHHHYNPYGMWNMPHMSGAPMPPPYMMPGTNYSQMFAQLGNTGNMQLMYPYFPQYPIFNGAAANLYFRF